MKQHYYVYYVNINGEWSSSISYELNNPVEGELRNRFRLFDHSTLAWPSLVTILDVPPDADIDNVHESIVRAFARHGVYVAWEKKELS